MNDNDVMRDVMNFIDNDFVREMKDRKAFGMLEQIPFIFAEFIAWTQIHSVASFVGSSINYYSMAVKYTVQVDEHKTPYASILISDDETEIITVFGAPYLSSDGEFRRNMFRIRDISSLKTMITNMMVGDQLKTVERLKGVCKIKTKSSTEYVRIRTILQKINYPFILLIYCLMMRITTKNYVISKNILPEYGFVLERLVELVELPEKSYKFKAPWILTSMGIHKGIKFIPGTYRDMDIIGDISKKCWRELYISKRVGLLSVNSICFNFNVLLEWFIVDGYDYDNILVRAKLAGSKNAKAIRNKLAKLVTVTEMGYDNLPEHIELSINYLDNNLLYSSKSIGMVLTTRNEVPLGSAIESPKYVLLSDEDALLSLMFQYTYALYCMNAKLGIIHNDLHINNVMVGIPKKPNGIDVYHMGNEYYYLKNYDMHGVIIDFSRSIFSYDAIEAMNQKSSYNVLIRSTTESIKASYKYYLPDYYENNYEHLAHVLHKYKDVVFKLFTAFDMFRLTMCFSNPPEIIKEINAMCLYTLTTVMDKVGTDIKSVNDFEYPNKSMLDELKGTPDEFARPGDICYYSNFNSEYEEENIYTRQPTLHCDIIKRIKVKNVSGLISKYVCSIKGKDKSRVAETAFPSYPS